MTIPLSIYEQMENNWFEPTHRLAFIFGMSKFNAVWKRQQNGSFKQAFADLDTIKDDCMQLSKQLEKYQIMTKNVYNLESDPTQRDVTAAIEQISKRMRAGKKKKPMERYLLIFLFAGHGLQQDGMQVMLYNEFNPKTNFYALFRAEKKLRQFAEIYPNAYVIGIFACCRQMYDHTWMEGGSCISHEQYLNITSEKGSEEQLLAHHQNLFNLQQKGFSEQYTTCLKDIETSFKRRVKETRNDAAQPQKESTKEDRAGESKPEGTKQPTFKGLDAFTLAKHKRVPRTYGYCSAQVHKNFFFIFGCPASKTVSADTSMVQEITATMDARFDKDTLKLTIPAAFESQSESNTQLEMSVSNPIQPLNLFYGHNIVSDSIGFIFVNTESNGLPYTNAAIKGTHAKTLLKDILEFKEVEVFTDLSKEEIIKKLEQLEHRANQQRQEFVERELLSKTIFDSLDEEKDGALTKEQSWEYVTKMSKNTGNTLTKEEFDAEFSKLDFDNNGKVSYKELQSQGLDQESVQDNLAIGIIWVGHTLDPQNRRHKNIVQELGILKDQEKEGQQLIGTDNSELLPVFELSHLGEPICINEYASNIAKHKGCHVIQLDDYQQDMGHHLTIDNVVSQPQQQEFILKERSGREDHIFFPETDIDQVVPQFQNRKQNIANVFCFPYHLQECGPEIHVWTNYSKRREQVIFDLRGEKEKEHTKKNRLTHTFKRHNCDVWQDRPELMNDEVAYPQQWRTTVHHLESQEAIVHIALDTDPEKVVYVFFNPVTFYEEDRVTCKRFNFNCAMTVEDRLDGEKQDPNCFYTVHFASTEDSNSSQLIKYSKNKKKWEVQLAKEFVSHPDDYLAMLVSAFQIERERIMLITWYRALTYNASLELLHTHNINDTFQRVKGIQVCAKDLLQANQKGYLISFQVDVDKLEKTDYKNVEQDFTTINVQFSSLIYRCTYDASSKQIARDKNEGDSLLLLNERVEAILEYAPNKSVISLYPADLLFIHNWKMVKLLKQQRPGNFNKHWLLPMPGFNEEKYPFLICSGREIFSLINVRDLKMSPLIDAPCINIRSQQAFFFKKEDFGFSVHFTTVQLTHENLEQQKWHMLPFKDDFVKYLIKFGNLPVTSFKQKKELHDRFDTLKTLSQLSKLGKNIPRSMIGNTVQQEAREPSNQTDLQLQYDNLQVKFKEQQVQLMQSKTKKVVDTLFKKNLLAKNEEAENLKKILEEKVVALENSQQELVARLKTSNKALQASKSRLLEEENQSSQQQPYRQQQQNPKFQDLSVLHEVIQQKDSEIQAKSEQIQSLKLMIQGGENSVSLSDRYTEEMNKVVEENKRYKAMIKDLETEVQCLKQVVRNPIDALIGAKTQNSGAYISALEDENNQIKAEKKQLKELFDQTIKDQIQLHDQNVQLMTKLRNLAKRYNAPSQQENAQTYTQELIKALEKQETNVEYLKIQLVEKEMQNKLSHIKLNELIRQQKSHQVTPDQPLELDVDFVFSSPRNQPQNKMSLNNFMTSEPSKTAKFMQTFTPLKEEPMNTSTNNIRKDPRLQNRPIMERTRGRNRSVNEVTGLIQFTSTEKNNQESLGMIQEQKNVNRKQRQFFEQRNVTTPKFIRTQQLKPIQRYNSPLDRKEPRK